PGAVRLLLLDDIDRGLHIAAQARLIDVLRKLLAARPDLQIVCTTHSPYLLSRCAPEEVRVMALDAERHTRVQRLVDHPRFEEVRYGFQTGEIWASFGEDWVIGDTPDA
ncbi:MAG TPA: AAA family ATPase, partial [Polyangia bacterium]|nr:AAA family ATPase [Polyangia bacterium]